ncbi:hypothetical protein LOAG_16297 [Loa loa]|uniref:Uncharacterized protein n=2 Tax=Loa loa TaxID=7209 RepID=A0A1S0TE73_LOALO|nr:hypothetical protein LOAG_16297 [Loa loa]EFO12236.1 hypothetical protein LOAG_16297 [Loa loa]
MLTAGMVETRKYENRKITFGVQTLSENVKNIQVQIVDSILERIPYVINNEREQLVESKWGKPYVLLGVEGIADVVIRNSMKHPPGWMIMETEVEVVEGGKRKVAQDSDTGNRNDESYKFKQLRI